MIEFPFVMLVSAIYTSELLKILGGIFTGLIVLAGTIATALTSRKTAKENTAVMMIEKLSARLEKVESRSEEQQAKIEELEAKNSQLQREKTKLQLDMEVMLRFVDDFSCWFQAGGLGVPPAIPNNIHQLYKHYTTLED